MNVKHPPKILASDNIATTTATQPSGVADLVAMFYLSSIVASFITCPRRKYATVLSDLDVVAGQLVLQEPVSNLNPACVCRILSCL